MNPVQKQSLLMALGLCAIRQRNGSDEVDIFDQDFHQLMEFPHAILTKPTSARAVSCFNLFIGGQAADCGVLLEELRRDITSPTIQDYQEYAEQYIVRTIRESKPFLFGQFTANLNELLQVSPVDGEPAAAIAVSHLHIEVVFNAIVAVCCTFPKNDHKDTVIYERLCKVSVVVQQAVLTVLSCTAKELRRLRDIRTKDSEEQSQREERALEEGDAMFRDWIVQSVASIVDSRVAAYPLVLDGLVTLARTID